jgi:hypothetical protein
VVDWLKGNRLVASILMNKQYMSNPNPNPPQSTRPVLLFGSVDKVRNVSSFDLQTREGTEGTRLIIRPKQISTTFSLNDKFQLASPDPAFRRIHLARSSDSERKTQTLRRKTNNSMNRRAKISLSTHNTFSIHAPHPD